MHRALAGQVERAVDEHAVQIHHLARLGGFAVAAGFRGQIDDHAARFHATRHRGADDFRRGPAGHGGGTDHHVHRAQVLAQAALLLGTFLIGQRPRVTTFADRAHAQVKEFAAQRFDLLAGFRTHIEAFHLRAETAGGRDGLQAGHAGADHQYLRGADRARSGGQHREEARRALRRDQGGFVARHAGLRTEHVHGLGPRGTRQALQRKRLQAARLDQPGALGIGLRMQHADQAGARFQPGKAVIGGWLHAQHEVGLGQAGVIGGLRAHVLIQRIGEAGRQPGTRFE